MTELERRLRAARRADPPAPPLDAVLAHAPARPSSRIGPPALLAAAALTALVVVFAGPDSPPAPEPPSATIDVAAASFTPPPSTDWLAEPMGVERLRAVPSLTLMGDDYGY